MKSRNNFHKRFKLVIVHNIVSPHTLSVYRKLSKLVRLKVLFCAQKEKNRKWSEGNININHKILPSLNFGIQGKDLLTVFVNPTILYELWKEKPNCILISGWDQPSYWLTFLYAKLTKTPIVVRSGSTENESNWRRIIFKLPVKVLVNGVDACVAYGSRAKRYLISLGVPKEKIFISYNTTELSSFLKIVRTKESKTKRTIFFYGQLIERKGVDLLLHAYKNISKRVPDSSLLIVGDGYMLDNLRSIEKDKGLKNVELLPNPGDKKVIRYYKKADCFVLPSREEVWGLVINQAMASELPVVVSDKVGAGVDLVDDGVNGYVFKSGSVDDLAKKILSIVSDSSKSMSMGKNSRRMIRMFTPKRSAQQMLRAVKYAYENKKR